MQGIFIDGRRPKSKKEVKEVAALDPNRIDIEATSFFGNEYGGPLSDLLGDDPVFPSATVNFVGPDPHTRRNFYGTLSVKDGKVTVK